MDKKPLIIVLTVLFIYLNIFPVVNVSAVSDAKVPSEYSEIEENNIWKKHKLIAHAMGGIDGITYTNSLEAFEYNYSIGYRLFEADLIATSDEELVVRHYWEEWGGKDLQQLKDGMTFPLSLSEFKSLKIYNKYTPLTLEDVINLMIEYPDLYIVTDTKDVDKANIQKAFIKIVEKAKELDVTILERIIPQLYNEEMLGYIEEIHNFDSYIYTLYSTNANDKQVLDFAKKEGIKVITMSTVRFNEQFVKELKDNGIYTYVHTINDKDTIKDYQLKGVHGFYSDFVIPSDIDVSAESFKDIPINYNYYKEITEVANLGIINGYQDGTFRPKQMLSRQHAATLVYRALKQNGITLKRVKTVELKDVKTTSEHYIALKILAEADLLTVENNEVKPQQTVTRGEIAKILATAFDVKAGKEHPLTEVSKQYNTFVSALYEAGITTGDNGKFKENDTLSREHYVVFLYRTLEHLGNRTSNKQF